MREPRPDMTDIAPCILVANGQHQRPEMRPGSLRRGEADNDRFLPLAGLDLEPVLAARAGEVPALRTLGHDALKVELLGLFEQALAMLRPVLAVDQQRILGQQSAQALLAFYERQAAQILASEEHDVEDAVVEVDGGPEGILKQL